MKPVAHTHTYKCCFSWLVRINVTFHTPHAILDLKNPSICFLLLSINQSNFYSANIPGEARLSGGKAKSKRCVLRCLLKVATEMAERTDSERLFQRDRAQE